MSHIHTLKLHQLRLGELSGEEEGQLRGHLASCDACARRFDIQADTRAEFTRQPIPPALAPRSSWWFRLRVWRPALVLLPALAAAALFVRPPEPEVREKGASLVLEAWVQTGQSARPLYVGERVGSGTRVQLKYNPGRHRFVTLAGRDGAGIVEVYGTVPAEGPGLHTAPFSLTLDDTPGDQELFAVMTDTRPQPREVVDVLESEPIRMERGEIASVVLKKD